MREPRGKQAVSTAMNGSGRVIGGPHPAFGHPLPEGEGLGLGRVAPAFGHPRNRLCQNASSQVRKANPSFPRKRESRGPGGVPTRRFPTPSRLDSRLPGRVKMPPLPLGEGWGEGTSWQAGGVNGNEWERQGYWGPSPGLRPPSPRGRGVGFGTGRNAFGHPRNRLCQNASSQVRKANPSFPRKRESRGPGGDPTRRFPTPPRLDSRFPGCVLQNCPLSLWERVGVRATPTAQAAIDPLSLRERVGVREPRGKQAGVNGNEWERQGYWGPSPGLRPPSPRGRGVGFGTGRTAKRTRRFVSVFVRHHTSGLSPW